MCKKIRSHLTWIQLLFFRLVWAVFFICSIFLFQGANLCPCVAVKMEKRITKQKQLFGIFRSIFWLCATCLSSLEIKLALTLLNPFLYHRNICLIVFIEKYNFSICWIYSFCSICLVSYVRKEVSNQFWFRSWVALLQSLYEIWWSILEVWGGGDLFRRVELINGNNHKTGKRSVLSTYFNSYEISTWAQQLNLLFNKRMVGRKKN